jgi:hypothetical protein
MKHTARFRSKLLFGMLALAGAALPGTGILRASDFKIQGTYAVHATIGPNVGTSMGIFNVDNSGAINGYAILNLPSPDGKSRMVVRVNVTGSVTVNPDGTGQAKYGGPLPNGIPASFVTEDFVITRAERQVGWPPIKLAMEIFSQRQEASTLLGNGYEVSVVWTRLPDDPGN